MTTILLALLSAPLTPAPLPTDPLQRMAYQAVVQHQWPGAPQWKLDAYSRVLARGVTIDGLCRRTNYCPKCSGMTCADGSRCRPGVCAASKNIAMHALIWTATEGLLKVTDRGGAVRVGDGYTNRHENARIDVWQQSCGKTCNDGTQSNVPWAVVPK